jgi:predicted nucleic acid-binding Zn ribbon protein
VPIAEYRCTTCGRAQERLEITTEDKAAAPPDCCGAQMARQCGSCSFAKVTPRGTWVKFSSNKPPIEHDRHAKGI